MVILEGAMAKAIAFAPFLGLPLIKGFVQGLLEHLLLDPALDELTVVALAVTYLLDRVSFDKKFIELSMLDKQNASPDQIEKALQDAEKSMARFIRRGPIQ